MNIQYKKYSWEVKGCRFDVLKADGSSVVVNFTSDSIILLTWLGSCTSFEYTLELCLRAVIGQLQVQDFDLIEDVDFDQIDCQAFDLIVNRGQVITPNHVAMFFGLFNRTPMIFDSPLSGVSVIAPFVAAAKIGVKRRMPMAASTFQRCYPSIATQEAK